MSAIFADGAKVERVFAEGFYTEGPAEGPDGRIYFCDITPTFLSGMAAGNIWAFNPATSATGLVRSPSGMASGIKFDADGRMVIAGGADFGCRSVIRTDLASGRSHILALASIMAAPSMLLHDLVIDRQGHIYFSRSAIFRP